MLVSNVNTLLSPLKQIKQLSNFILIMSHFSLLLYTAVSCFMEVSLHHKTLSEELQPQQDYSQI